MTDLNREDIREQTLPLILLNDAANIVQRGLEKRLSHLDLGVAQQRILTAVYFAEDRLTPSMLAALLLQETHSISGMLNRLEDRGLITRTRDRQDRRVVWVGLTPAGREVVEQAIPIVTSFAQELAHVFGGGAGSRTVEVLGEARDQCMKIAKVPEDVRQDALRRLWGELTG